MHQVARIALGCIWIYQGLVPKIIFPTTGDRTLTILSGALPSTSATITTVVGVLEICLGLALLLFRRARWLFIVQSVALALLPLGLILRTPLALAMPLGPVPLTIAMLALAWVGWTASASTSAP